jgi:hypothetical protein
MDNIIEKYSNNGWQNIGICSIFAEENIQYSKIPLYMHLVRRSFGYSKKVTNRISQLEMAKRLKIDKKTLASHMKYLVENEFVEIVCSTSYVDGGGSESYAYAPCYPKGYGKLCFKDNMQSPTSSGSKKQEPEKWSSENLTF